MAKKNSKPKQTIITGPELEQERLSYRFKPKNQTQADAWRAIAENDYTLLSGVAGSGKTYLAMAYAIDHYRDYDKIIISRPAVESGESLGYLPGTTAEKLSPYLTPIFEAMDKVTKTSPTIKERIGAMVEMLPLAYTRGRTFERSFCILDEAQNASPESIEMYMTRLGEGSKMVLCGDDGQPDIDRCVFGEVARAFHDAGEAGWVEFKDSVRHPRILSVIRIMAPFKNQVSRRRR